MRRWNRQVIVALVLCVGMSGLSGPASAALGDPASASASYKVIESEIGGSGCANKTVPACGASASYSLDPSVDDGGASLGESAVGNSASASYQTNGGFNTTAQPGLMLALSTPSVNLGVLSVAAANTATASFSVRNYTSSGYVVQIIGQTPAYAGHHLTAMTTNPAGDASQNTVEQFGLNLVFNQSPTNPVPGSANPVCQAAGYCFGVAGDGVTGTYGSTRPYTVGGVTAKYRYVSGETVASGPKSTGETDYTITFLANQSTTTPSGAYSGALSIVATGTF
jgi:hypothetical protein